MTIHNDVIDMEKMPPSGEADVFEKINQSSSFLRMFETFSFYNLRKRLKLFDHEQDEACSSSLEDDADNPAARKKTKPKNKMNINVNEYADDDYDDDSSSTNNCGTNNL
jgi:hypothetical protein